MSEFTREHRYWVIKRKHLSPEQDEECRQFCGRLRHEAPLAADIEAVVVESDWPIYGEVWNNVRRMAEGRPSIGTERNALAAHGKRIIKEWNADHDDYEPFSDEWVNHIGDVVEDAPTASLACRDAAIRAGTIGYLLANNCIKEADVDELRKHQQELIRQAKGGD